MKSFVRVELFDVKSKIGSSTNAGESNLYVDSFRGKIRSLKGENKTKKTELKQSLNTVTTRLLQQKRHYQLKKKERDLRKSLLKLHSQVCDSFWQLKVLNFIVHCLTKFHCLVAFTL